VAIYLKQTKMSFFSFCLFSFFFYKIGEQEGRTGPAQGGGSDTSGSWGGGGESGW
jgi:hypothetical protein